MPDTKVLHGRDCRLTISDYEIIVEQLPMPKAHKPRLLRWSVHLGWQRSQPNCNALLVDNVIENALGGVVALADGVTPHFDDLLYSEVVAKLEAEIATANAEVPSHARARPQTTEVHYANVRPRDAEPIVVGGKDFSFTATWTSFEIYSPSSDFQQADPYYSYVGPSAPTSARKLYKLLKADPKAMSNLTWDQVTDWLRARKIGYDMHHSVWR